MPAINAVRNPDAAAVDGARVLPMWHGPGFDVLPQDDLERLVEAVLGLLRDPGIEVRGPAILDALRAAGADVETGWVRLSEGRVLEMLADAPGDLLFAGRDPTCDLRVDGRHGWLTTDGRAASVVESLPGEPHAASLDDVAALARLVDAGPPIGLAGPPPVAGEIPSGVRPLRELHAQLANTSKHIQVEAPADVETAHAVAEIARAVAGGEAALRARPVVSATVPLTAPLTLERLDATVALARAGIPCGFVAPAGHGALAGALATAAAASLAGALALRLLAPGAPVFLGAVAPAPSVAPRFQLAWVQLARRLGLRARIDVFATTAVASDWRAGSQGGLSGTAAWMSPPDLLVAAGTRDGGRVLSLAAMLLDTELFDLVRQIPLGFDVDDEALAVEVIDEVGPGEHFLGEQHTLHHFRETWMSRFMDTSTWEAWEAAGRPEPPVHAAERARELLATHESAPLPAGVDHEISEVIARHAYDR